MKLSIITINKNNCDGLLKTMTSVFNQEYKQFEYIIVDGGSNDNSVATIKKFDQLNNGITFTWISEHDNGIYSAMNKGIKKTKGEYLLFLNSGDYLWNNNVIANVLPLLDQDDIIQGNEMIYKHNSYLIRRGYGKSNISFIDAFNGNFLHQASFIKRELFDIYGLYDETYKINGDTVFFAKCLALGNASFRYEDIIISYYDSSGISADPDHKYTHLRHIEDQRYRNELFSSRLLYLLDTSQKKINLYEKLHSSKIAWYTTMCIVRILSLCNRK